MGKIGLCLAVQYAKKGKKVVGVDINRETIRKINKGEEPFPGEKNLSEFLKEVVEQKLLYATSDYGEALNSSNVIVIATPLLTDESNNPDFEILDNVSKLIGQNIKAGSLVILETTVPIGTTRTRLTKTIENFSHMKAGHDFFVAFSPERVFTGRVFEDLREYPKLVGGIDVDSGERALAFYETVLDFDERKDLHRKNGVWQLESSESAEFAKLAETTYRDVNIALANTFAKHAKELNLDIEEIILASNSQHFSSIHTPGIWVGGHCIPVYPHLYLLTHKDAHLVRTARETNVGQATEVIRCIEESIENLSKAKVGILGLAYRQGVKEAANSGTPVLARLLQEKGATVYVTDPLYSSKELREFGLNELKSNSDVEILILHTAHDSFRYLTRREFPNVRLIIDGRNYLESEKWDGVQIVRF